MSFAYLFKLSWLMLWRAWRATVVVASMILLAVGVLVFLLSLAIGTSDAMIRNSTGLYAGHVVASDMTAQQAQAIRSPQDQVHGVKQVLLRQHLPVLLQSRQGMEAVELVGVTPSQEKEATAYWRKTIQGAYLKDGDNTIFLSDAIAARLELSTGDEVSLLDRHGAPLKRLKLAGVYKTGIAYLDNGVAFSPMQALPTGEGKFSAAIFLEAGAPLEEIVMHYKRQLPSVTVLPWSEFMPDLKQLIDLNDFCMNILIVLVFVIVAVGVSCTFLIFTLKNLREHGIMKAMGFTTGDTILLLIMQIGLLTLMAAVSGTIIGAAVAWAFSHQGIDISAYISHNQYFVVSGVLYPRLTALALFAPPLLALCFSLLAAVWPIAYVLRRNPADILRSV